MTQDSNYHRTFLPDGPFESRCRQNCHGNGSGGSKEPKWDPELFRPSKPRNPVLQGFPMNEAPPTGKPKLYYASQKRRQAFMLASNQIQPIFVVEKVGQSFAGYATDWERKWSVLVDGGSQSFQPVVDANLTVIGHVGTVTGGNLIVVKEDLGKYGFKNYYGPIDEFLKKDEPMFAGIAPPDGWTKFDELQPSSYYTVVVNIDGAVLMGVHSGSAPGAIAVNGPMDYISLAAVVRTLGKAVIKSAVVRSLTRKFSTAELAKLLTIPTRKLADLVRRIRLSRRLNWRVVRESPQRIPGSSIPVSMDMQVNGRLWNIERNAGKITNGQPIGPTTKHLGEHASRHNRAPMVSGQAGQPHSHIPSKQPDVKGTGSNVYGQHTQVDFPMSSLAGALAEAEKRVIKDATLSGKIFRVEGWELGISTKEKVWKVWHAVYNPAFK